MDISDLHMYVILKRKFTYKGEKKDLCLLRSKVNLLYVKLALHLTVFDSIPQNHSLANPRYRRFS